MSTQHPSGHPGAPAHAELQTSFPSRKRCAPGAHTLGIRNSRPPRCSSIAPKCYFMVRLSLFFVDGHSDHSRYDCRFKIPGLRWRLPSLVLFYRALIGRHKVMKAPAESVVLRAARVEVSTISLACSAIAHDVARETTFRCFPRKSSRLSASE